MRDKKSRQPSENYLSQREGEKKEPARPTVALPILQQTFQGADRADKSLADTQQQMKKYGHHPTGWTKKIVALYYAVCIYCNCFAFAEGNCYRILIPFAYWHSDMIFLY